MKIVKAIADHQCPGCKRWVNSSTNHKCLSNEWKENEMRYNPMLEECKRIMSDGQPWSAVDLKKALPPGIIDARDDLSARLSQWKNRGNEGIYQTGGRGSPYYYSPQTPDQLVKPRPASWPEPVATVPLPGERNHPTGTQTAMGIRSIVITLVDGTVVRYGQSEQPAPAPTPIPPVHVPAPVCATPKPVTPPQPPVPAPQAQPQPQPLVPAPAYRNIDDCLKSVMAKGDGWLAKEVKAVMLQNRSMAYIVKMHHKNHVNQRLVALAKQGDKGFMKDEETKRYHYLGD
jgi:hypothetical protein